MTVQNTITSTMVEDRTIVQTLTQTSVSTATATATITDTSTETATATVISSTDATALSQCLQNVRSLVYPFLLHTTDFSHRSARATGD